MNLTKSFSLLLTILLSVLVSANAQDEVPLTSQHKIYTKGGSLLVGNTILGKHKSNAFDSNKTSNDLVDMVYVDVDTNDETFSSSSANIIFPDKTSKILYAALYWSGLYPAEKSTMRLGKQRAYYKKKGGRQEAVDSIKIKWANQPYTDIKGEVIFDAKKKGKFKKDSPYVCRADITKFLTEANFNGGNFTVANIRAARGKLEGGSAAGWHLYIVYENLKNSAKFFTTFDGFRQVAKEPVEIIFSDFKTKTAGDIESTLILATLEGDIKIKSDQCAVYSPFADKFITLQTPNREGTNFFNSSITIYSEMFLDRNPASKNTLGFDLLKMKLSDSVISNNTNKVNMRFKSKADRFYLYFTAFETEIEESLMLEKNPETIIEDVSSSNVEIMQPSITSEYQGENAEVIAVRENEIAEKVKNLNQHKDVSKLKQELAITPIDSVKVKTGYNVDTIKTPQLKKAIVRLAEKDTLPVEKHLTISANAKIPVSQVNTETEQQSIAKLEIAEMTSGYFLITNVFSVEKLARDWMEYLKFEGYNPQQFINPQNGWIYVYILKAENFDKVKMRQTELQLHEDFKDIWIAGINL